VGSFDTTKLRIESDIYNPIKQVNLVADLPTSFKVVLASLLRMHMIVLVLTRLSAAIVQRVALMLPNCV
jgi:hypothetical protein